MRTVGVGHHGKQLSMPDQFINQPLGVLVVYVIVAGAMDEEEVPLKIFGMGNRSPCIIIAAIFLRQAHIAFGVDVVIEAGTGDRGDGDARFINFGVLKEQVQGAGAPAAPSPYGHARSINKIPLQDFLCGHGLVADVQLTDIAIDGFAPFPAFWRRGSAIVYGNMDIAICGHISVIKEAIRSSKPVIDGGSGRFAIDVKH